MVRASNPGAPQRVSAHVLPKAPAVSRNDEEEKTTIESGWEEEASTTVEQGEVADKIRAIGRGMEPPRRPNTNITSTNGGSMPDEPTVDDQRAAAALAMLPPPIVARLVITQGNDSGQSLEVRPGKTYTIGRGIDNDLVLTDIAVSRKHFDIRNENGSWVLADRGSGNGTLVNQRIEDAPFTLASGDMIEIGNTAFRFDFPNDLSRVRSSYDVSVDDDLELSTVSGKPLREAEVATPLQHVAPITTPLGSSKAPTLVPPGLPPSTAALEPLGRPKTLSPPSPLPRPRTQSSRPPIYPLDRPGPYSQPLPLPSLAAALAPTMSPMQSVQALPPPPMPATTLPLPQMANRRPLPPAALIDPPLSTGPATIPGQGPPVPAPHHGRFPFSYPRASEQPLQLAPNGSRGQPLVMATGLPGRDATSTALVPPMSYANGQAAAVPAPPYRSSPPQLSRRVKMVLAGAGLALFAAVSTIAIIKGTSGDGDPAGRATGKAIGKATNAPPPPLAPSPKPITEAITETITEAITDPRSVKAAVPTAPDKDKPVAPPSPTPNPVTPRTDKVATATTTSPPVTTTPAPSNPPPNPAPAPSPPTPPSGVAPAAPNPVTPKTGKVATTTPTPTAGNPTTGNPTAGNPATPGPTTPNPVTTPPTAPTPPPPVAAKTDQIATTIPAPTTPSPATANRVEPAPPTTDKTDKRTLKHPPDKRTEKKPTQPRNDIARVEPDRSPKVEVATASAKTDKKHGGRSTQDVKNDANALYRAKRFADAAALVTSSLPAFSGADSQELKAVAAVYSQLGKTYNVGMAPGTKPTDAFVALRRAISYDRDAGSAYIAEMEHVLVTVGSKAALSYTAAKEYELAFTAVRTAESLGSQSPTNKSVRERLEELAAELLRSAASEQATDPEGAKKKLHQIQGMVDPKSPTYAKATKQLSGL